MISNAGFSPRDWDLAPHYESPINAPGAVILDFRLLNSLVEQEEEIGSFRPTADGTLAKAPVFIDDLPAAFYRVNTSYPHFTPNHNTSGCETLVVVEGVLKLAMNDCERTAESDNSIADTFYSGQVIELRDRAIAMQAIGLVDPARCLALALFRDEEDKKTIVPLAA